MRSTIEHPSGVIPQNEHERRMLEYGDLLENLSGESDRGLVIAATAHVEIYLERILKAFLVDDKDVNQLFDGPYAPFGTLSGKVKAAFLMGLITSDEADRVNAMRKVRNIFAHEINASFKHSKVKKICTMPPIHDGRLCERDAFLHVAINMTPRLMHREIGIIAHHKRESLTEEARGILDGMSSIS